MGEMDIHLEHTSFVCTALWARYGGLPVVEAGGCGCEGDGAEVLLLCIGYLAVDALHGHLYKTVRDIAG